MQKLSSLFLRSLLVFLIRYRRTALGPIWLLAGPALFLVIIGSLYGIIGNHDPDEFIPHLTVGLVYWAFISAIITQSPNVFTANRAFLLQGSLKLEEIIFTSLAENFIMFCHQLILIIVVLIIFNSSIDWNVLLAIPGFVLALINGYYFSFILGILGARYRDIGEFVPALMRIAFLATPIIWMPGEFGRGASMGTFLNFNPFNHAIEVFRAPLLGNQINLTSWVFLTVTALFAFGLSCIIRRQCSSLVPLWV